MSKGGEREERVIALYKHLRTLTLLLYSSCILYYLTTGWEGARKFMVLMIPLSIVLWVADSLSRGERLIPKIKNIYVNSAIGLTFIFIALASWYYLNANFWDLVSIRMGFYTDIDLIVGGLLSLLVLWYGALKYPIIFVIVVFFIIHVLYGRFFPGILYHPGISFQRMVAAFSVDFSTGIFESLPQIGATIISAFMLLVGIINGFGVVRSINNIVVAKLHKRPELIPQSNILVGTPIGMVTGSAGAATATVGSVTVPLIKSLGITLPAAAAMAAASGIGAQLMPPVMGASAFIMADALGVSYFDVMIRGFIPALVYFGGISVAMFYLTLRSVKKSTSKLNVSSGRPGNESSLISSKAYRL
ncbi:MAG: TRAP transporter large permease subunit, partial [Desulfurococcaceae archaeon]